MTYRWRCKICGLQTTVERDEFPVTCCGIRHKYPQGVIRQVPGILNRAANFAGATVNHLAGGMQLVDDATREWRRQQCLACTEYFDPDLETCTHKQCGCGMKKKRGIIDALGWASKKCPIGRWQYAPITTRNLIYHVCPIISNDGWRMNVRQLLKRWRVFNGQRIIAIAIGENMESPDAVHRAFLGEDYDFIVVPNDANLRETATFVPLLDAVSNTNRNEATFYAHTKGNSTAWHGDPLGPVYWRNEMYHRLLDHHEECVRHLTDNVMVGCHKLCWYSDGRPSPFPTHLENKYRWMFAGTFFWFRNDAVFGHSDWRSVSMDRYGTEAWPGQLFGAHQVKSVYQQWEESKRPMMSPYVVEAYPNPIPDESL